MPNVYACLGHCEDCKRSNWNTPFDTLRVCHFLLLILDNNLSIRFYLFLLFTISFAQGYLCCTNGRYSHSMGNSNGNIHEYWEAIDSTSGLQGGFIWEWVDQVKRPLSLYKYIDGLVNCLCLSTLLKYTNLHHAKSWLSCSLILPEAPSLIVWHSIRLMWHTTGPCELNVESMCSVNMPLRMDLFFFCFSY